MIGGPGIFLLYTILYNVYMLQMSNTINLAIRCRTGRCSPGSSPSRCARRSFTAVWRPGEPLRQEQPRRSFQVSRIPAARGPARTGERGLDRVAAQRGARVSLSVRRGGAEIYEIRASLEVHGAAAWPIRTTRRSSLKDGGRGAARRAPASAAPALRAAQSRVSFRTVSSGRPAPLAPADRVAAQPGERYLRLKLDMPTYKRASDDEHQAIFERCASARSTAPADSAVALLRNGDLLATIWRAPCEAANSRRRVGSPRSPAHRHPGCGRGRARARRAVAVRSWSTGARPRRGVSPPWCRARRARCFGPRRHRARRWRSLIRPGDRVALEGNNQKQADFLSRSLAERRSAQVA